MPKTEYRSGLLTLVQRGGVVAYFSAIKRNNCIFSGPSFWIGTLKFEAPAEDHNEIAARTYEATVRWLERRMTPMGQFSEDTLCPVDEEFFLAFGSEMPGDWHSVQTAASLQKAV